MAVYSTINSFNAGELSSKMLARPDVAQYQRGCQTLENFLVTPYGSIERRPGTQLLDALEDSSQVRLMRFEYNSDNTYLLMFTQTALRIYKGGSFVFQFTGAAYPWAGLDPYLIQSAQSADVLFLVHPAVAPYLLSRVSDAAFTLAALDWSYPPLLDSNTETNQKITAALPNFSISYPKGTAATLTAQGFEPFSAASVGEYLEITGRRPQQLGGEFTASGSSGSCEVKGAWTLTTHGSWIGALFLQRSFDGGANWESYLSWSSNADSNVAASGDESGDYVLYQIVMSGYSAATSGTVKKCIYNFSNPDFEHHGVYRITAVTSSTNATAVLINRGLYAVSSTDWAWGAFSSGKGFPGAICFYQQRLFLGGTNHDPQRLWSSATNDYKNFQVVSGQDDSALDFTLASDTISRIRWMTYKDALLVGTSDSEWSVGPSSSSKTALTASDLRLERQSVYGSPAGVPAVLVDSVVMFAQKSGTKLRAFQYNWEQDGYTAADLTLLADQIGSRGFRYLAVQKSPDTIIWCLLGDGTLATLTYDAAQELQGWARMTHRGEVLAVEVLPSASGEDEVYIATRQAGAVYPVYLERFFPRQFSGLASAVYLDAAMPVNVDSIWATPYGRDVEVLYSPKGDSLGLYADGEYVGEYIVDSLNEIHVGKAVTSGWTGFPFISLVSPLPPELQLQNGHSMLRSKTINRMLADVYASLGGEIRAGGGAWQEPLPREIAADALDTLPTEKTGIEITPPGGGYERRLAVQVRQTLPYPFNLSSLALYITMGD